MKSIFLSLLFVAGLCGANAQTVMPDLIPTTMGALTIQPVKHATVVLAVKNLTIYVDPTSDGDYTGIASPNIILVTHIHGDHFDVKKLEAIKGANTILIVPQNVADKLPEADKSNLVILKNGESTTQSGITIKAVPMYNLPPSPTAMHPKGLGNGYVLGIGGKNIYLSGDTQGTPEMRSLKNIDVAFVCMNLPYTMDIKEAASTVLEFKPKIVYPYHYRGKDGLSDVNAFKTMVNAGDPKIDVRLRNWYPSK